MAFRKTLAYEAFMQRNSLRATDFPEWLQAVLRLFIQDLAAAGDKLTPELQTRADDLADEIKEWHDDEDEEPAPAPEPPAPVPAVATDPLTPEQVLMQLLGQGKTKVTAAELKAAGFTPRVGPTGGSWGNYQLAKALFGNKYTITQKR